MSKWVHVPVQGCRVATETWGVLSYHSPLYCHETMSLTEMDVHHLAKAAWPVSSQNLHVSAPSCWDYSHEQPYLALFMMLRPAHGS